MTVLYVFLAILLILILLSLILLFSEFTVIMSTEGKNISVRLEALGLSFKLPLDKKTEKKAKKTKKEEPTKNENEESVMKKLMDMRNNFTRSKKALELAIIYLKNKIKLCELGVMGEFGTGNAAATGIAYGAFNAFVNTVFGFLGQFFSIKNPPETAVKLEYNKAVFNIKFAFMVKTKPFYLLKAFLIYKDNIK